MNIFIKLITIFWYICILWASKLLYSFTLRIFTIRKGKWVRLPHPESINTYKSFFYYYLLSIPVFIINFILLYFISFQPFFNISNPLKILLFLIGNVLLYIVFEKALEQNEALHFKLSITPFDDVHFVDKSSKLELRDLSNKDIDFFISYKSENIVIARFVADLLTSCKCSVWFAEYRILISNRDKFQQEIDRGIIRARKGIFISNDKFLTSEYTQYELGQLLKPENCGPEKIVEIKTCDASEVHSKFPKLESALSVQYTGNLNDLKNSLATVLFMNFPKHNYLFTDKNAGYQIKVPGFKLRNRGGTVTKYGYKGAFFRSSFMGNKVILEIKIGPIFSTTGKSPIEFKFKDIEYIRRTLQEAEPMRNIIPKSDDDRELYNELITMNRLYLQQFSPKCVGIHLFQYCGKNHLIITYWGNFCWIRRYHILLFDSLNDWTIEYNLIFNFYGPFYDVCQVTHLMDEIVGSLKPV